MNFRQKSTNIRFPLMLFVVITTVVFALAGYALTTEAGGGSGTRAEKVTIYDRSNGDKVKSATWNRSFGSLKLRHDTPRNFLRGWLVGLSSPNVTVKYYAKIVNVDTGKIIPDGSNIPVGTKIRLEPLKSKNTDIAWFGTGHAADSPYGQWWSGAGRPTWACKSSDYVATVQGSILYGKVRVYTALNVNPPKRSYDMSLSTAGLEKHNDRTYTIISPGTIKPRITFESTYGKFYHQRKNDGSCWVFNKAMRSSSNPSEPYRMRVPSRTIGFKFTAVDATNPPNPPEISGPQDIKTGTKHTYSFVATDPDGDDIRYLIDWNMDGEVDAHLPIIADGEWVVSGTSLNIDKQLESVGTYTFQARTLDINGNRSGWTQYTINVSEGVIISSCSADRSTIYTGGSVTWSADVSGGLAPYTYSWSGTDGLVGSGPTIEKTYVATGNESAVVTVTDEAGGEDVHTCNILTVEAPPPPPAPPPPAPPSPASAPSIEVDRSLVRSGDSTLVSWNPNGNTCTLSDNLSMYPPDTPNVVTGSATSSKSVSVTNMTTFSIQCEGDVSDEVTVRVLPSVVES